MFESARLSDHHALEEFDCGKEAAKAIREGQPIA